MTPESLKRTFWISSIFLLCATAAYGDQDSPESICYGTTQNGRLENGVKLQKGGPNFVPYSNLGVMIGRTYVHSKVREVILNAYRSLETSHPEKIYMYGETGLKKGGRFKPHKTHQNGLSVDFMVPVLDQQGKSVPLPTGPFNKGGYRIEFDKNGEYKNLTIDFEAMSAHIRALYIEAQKAGIEIWRVIFDPQLQEPLFNTEYGNYIRNHVSIPGKRSWIRHDEHYHVDFKLKCKPLKH